MIQTAAAVWRKYVIDGVPGSGPNLPDKSDISAWGTYLESLLNGSAAGLAYATAALLIADLAHPANTLAIVYGDASPGNNGMYVKIGASGSGSWTRIGDLANGIVRLTVTGGTGNAIVATAPETPTVPGAKLYLLTPSSSNTTATTIVVNGAAAVPVKNAFGVDLASGSLINGSQVLMAWAVDHYQILISAVVDGSAILAAVTAAVTDAETARDAAIAAAGTNIVNFEKISAARAYTVPSVIKYFRTAGRAAAGDGGAALYSKLSSTPSPVKAWHEQTADGAYWVLCPLPVLRPEMLDAFPDGTDAGPGIRSCRDYIAALGGGTLDFGPKGRIFTVSTLRTERMFEPAPNMTVTGFGTIKLANSTVTGSASFFGIGTQTFETDNCDNFRAEGVTLDFNGTNNLTTGYCAGVLIGVGADVTLDGITIKNHPGSQQICLGVNAGLSGEPSTPQILRPKVINCRIENCGYVVNSSLTDSSAIYMVGAGFDISGNVIANDTQDTVGTGIEAHGTGTIRGNVIRKVHKGFNIGAYPDTDVTVSGNKITDCHQYVMLWNFISGQPTFSVSAIFQGDHVVTSLVNASYFIDLSSSLTGSAAKVAKFVGCHFESTVAPANAAFIPAVGLGPIQHIEFSACSFIGFPGAAIAIGGTDIIHQKTTIHINGNHFLNCCTTSTSGHATAVNIAGSNALASVIASCNTFQNSGGAYATECFSGGALTTAVGASLGIFANNVKSGVATMGP
jgi:hypothetical protein